MPKTYWQQILYSTYHNIISNGAILGRFRDDRVYLPISFFRFAVEGNISNIDCFRHQNLYIQIFHFRNFELFISELSELIQGFVIFAQTISAEYNDEEAKLSSS